jgi:hypothetical protein
VFGAVELCRYGLLKQVLQADDAEMRRLMHSWPAHLVRDPNHMVANLKILSEQMGVPRVGGQCTADVLLMSVCLSFQLQIFPVLRVLTAVCCCSAFALLLPDATHISSLSSAA